MKQILAHLIKNHSLTLILCLSFFLLLSCGNKGPLTIPETPTENQSSILKDISIL